MKARWLRHPRTTAEIRAGHAAKAEGMPFRGKRRPARLPTCWDDQPIAGKREDRGKNYRRGGR